MNKSTNNQLNGQRLLKHVQTREWVRITKICMKGTIVSLGTCWIYILQSAIYLNSPQSCFSCDSLKLPLSNRKKYKTAGLEKITLSIIIIIIITVIIISSSSIIMIFLRWSEDKALA